MNIEEYYETYCAYMNIELELPITIQQLAKVIHKSPQEIKDFFNTMGWRPGANGELKTEQAIWIIEREGFHIKVNIKAKKRE